MCFQNGWIDWAEPVDFHCAARRSGLCRRESAAVNSCPILPAHFLRLPGILTRKGCSDLVLDWNQTRLCDSDETDRAGDYHGRPAIVAVGRTAHASAGSDVEAGFLSQPLLVSPSGLPRILTKSPGLTLRQPVPGEGAGVYQVGPD